MIIQAKKIIKVFPGTIALNEVDFELEKGEIHAIIGENGAGKSTFIKILCGIYRKDSGELYLNGKNVNFLNSIESSEAGIRVIHQELENLPKLTVAENIFLGRLPKNKRLPGFINWTKLITNSEKLLKENDIELNPRVRVSSLSIAQQQLVEIAKALSKNLHILIMDEPTSFLSSNETEKLFKIINRLKKQNVSVIYISHRLNEVIDIADRITVFRDGKNVGTLVKNEFEEERLIRMVIGHNLSKQEKQIKVRKEVVLEVKNLNIYKRLNEFDMKLYKGEILGLAGLIGCGKDELIKSLVGLWPYQSGEIFLFGKKVNIKEPFNAINKEVVYLPEERKTSGLFLQLSVRENLSVIWLQSIFKKFLLLRKQETLLTKEYIKKVSIKTTGPEQKIINLSGGNQQKVIFARILSVKPKILLLHDPTRGIDIGSKEEIYKIINELAEEGSSILFISSEIQEVCNLSHRVIVLSKGKVISEFIGDQIDIEKVLASSMSS